MVYSEEICVEGEEMNVEGKEIICADLKLQ